MSYYYWLLAVSIDGGEGMLPLRPEWMHHLAACRSALMHMVGGVTVIVCYVGSWVGREMWG